MEKKFKNINEAFIFYYNEIIKNGYENDETFFLTNVLFTIESAKINDYIVDNEYKKISLTYLLKEIAFYESESSFILPIFERNEIWKNYAKEDKVINYGEILNNNIDYIVNNIYNNTRRAFINIYDINKVTNYSPPCCMFIGFYPKKIIGNIYYIEYYITFRSTDLLFGLPYDIIYMYYYYLKLSQKFFEKYKMILKLENVRYYINNFHIYKNQLNQLTNKKQ